MALAGLDRLSGGLPALGRCIAMFKYLSPDRSPSAWKDANGHLNGVMAELRMRQAAAAG
jgi:hypothetical protein